MVAIVTGKSTPDAPDAVRSLHAGSERLFRFFPMVRGETGNDRQRSLRRGSAVFAILLLFLWFGVCGQGVQAATPYDTSPYPDSTGWFDDFSTSSLPSWSNATAWTIASGRMNATSATNIQNYYDGAPCGNGTYTWNFFQDPLVSDSSWSVYLLFASQSVLNGNPSSTGTHYAVIMNNASTGSNYIRLQKVIGGSPTTLSTSTYQISPGVMYRLSCTWNPANATSLIVYRDGIQILSSTNAEITADGYAGIGATSTSPGIKFDNVSFAFRPAPRAVFTSNVTAGTDIVPVAFTDISDTMRYGHDSTPTIMVVDLSECQRE